MAWGFWRKIKDGFRKAGQWINNKIVKPVVNTARKIIKPIINTGIKLAPGIGGAVATAMGAPPQVGMLAGTAVQGVGNSLGYG